MLPYLSDWQERQAHEESVNKTPEENCWNTGEYTDDCICETCAHAYECSGSNIKEDDDDE